MSVGQVWRDGAWLVLLDVVPGQEDPVLQVRQGGAEVLGLVSGVPATSRAGPCYAVSNVHTETEHWSKFQIREAIKVEKKYGKCVRWGVQKIFFCISGRIRPF